MIPVARGGTVRQLEQNYASQLGVPTLVLMELASMAVAHFVRDVLAAPASRGVLVVCGSGNNGGDGYGCARWLHQWGIPVQTWSLGSHSNGDAGVMRAAAKACGVPETDAIAGCGLVVDALFGTGLARPLVGEVATAITAIHALRVPVLAVDLPSGLDADRGEVRGAVIQASHTLSLGCLKPSLFVGIGERLAGEVGWADLGLRAVAAPGAWDAEVPEATDLQGLWPVRGRGDHKNRSGHLVIVAGSRAMAGAAVLAAKGALSAGVGLLTLVVPDGAVARLAGLPPEVMLRVGKGEDRLESLPAGALDGASAVAAGPGLGGGVGLLPGLGSALRALWNTCPLPVAFDADALPCVSPAASAAPRLVTPHPGEAARMLQTDVAAVEADRFGAVARLAAPHTALLKGRHSLVAEPSRSTSINPRNSSLLATGGSGDVLLGVAGALLARGLSAFDAARCAAWVHGTAAQDLESSGMIAVTASEIAGAIPTAIAALVRGEGGSGALYRSYRSW